MAPGMAGSGMEAKAGVSGTGAVALAGWIMLGLTSAVMVSAPAGTVGLVGTRASGAALGFAARFWGRLGLAGLKVVRPKPPNGDVNGIFTPL